MRVSRATTSVVGILRRPRSRWVRALVGSTAVVLLVVATVVAMRNVPPGTELRWWAVILLVLVGTPVRLFLLTTEVSLTGRLAGVHLSRRTSVHVAIVGTAMNQLPVPGAVLTRLDAVIGAGAGLRRATAAIMVVGVTWVAISLELAGFALLGTSWVAVLVLGAGAAAATGVWTLVRRLRLDSPRVMGHLVAIEALFTLASAARYALALLALDAAFPLRAPLTMAASTALATAVGVAPGGLGLKEGLATVFGGLAGIPASVALLAALIDRATALVGSLLSGVLVLPITSRRQATP